MKYEIGQQVYRATWDTRTAYVICPDCGGTGRLRVTFHDETQVSIECRNCSVGYDPPTGQIKVYERQPRASITSITGCEIEGTKIDWRTADSYRVPEEELFTDYDACMDFARSKAAKADQEERDRINNKEKDTRTWAWNATYHRNQIKEAKRQIEYHSAKLAVAVVKAKETKAA